MEEIEKEGSIGRKYRDKNKNIMRYKCTETTRKTKRREKEKTNNNGKTEKIKN
jgi:hypothetical protein